MNTVAIRSTVETTLLQSRAGMRRIDGIRTRERCARGGGRWGARRLGAWGGRSDIEAVGDVAFLLVEGLFLGLDEVVVLDLHPALA